MTAPLAAPALARARPRIAIIGAGPGGLAAAMLLAASGARVTLFERAEVVGGRTRTLTTEQGYRFDLGPTFFLYPRILREVFERCGAHLEEEIELLRLDPLYRLVFEGRGATLDATHDLDAMEAAIARIAPGDARGLRPFLAENRAKLAAFRPVLERAHGGMMDYTRPDMMRALPLLRPHASVDRDLGRFFRDPLIRLAFSFQTKYLGMSPYRCPSLFTILSFLEHEHGIFHPRGGCGAVSAAMARVAERLGAEIHLSTPVEQIAFAGRRAIGVETGQGHHPADAVVVNADFAGNIPKLIPDALRRGRWRDQAIASARYSCSTFMLYLGVEGQFPGLAHHSVVLARDYARNLRQIEGGELPDEPSFYLHHPGATDPSMAPPGHSALYLLVPVPNLRCGLDWTSLAARYREVALDRLQALGLPDLRPRIRYERALTPQDWQDGIGIGYGATFNLSHDLGQMLSLRPGNRFREVEGVYLVGGGTHPGSGLPVIYEGARITTGLIAADFGLSPRATRPGTMTAQPAPASTLGAGR